MASSISTAKKVIEKAADCPCSALALNCCQFGCFIPNVPIVEFGYDHANWMAELTKVHPDVPLRDLVLPGSHDSASSSISTMTLFSAVGRTQNVSVAEQLHRGARYLDLRIGGVKGGTSTSTTHGVTIVHGCLSGGNLVDVIPHIVTFLNDHPGEFIFVELVQEYGRHMTSEQKKFALDYLKDQFGDKLYTRNDCQHLLNHTTLRQLQDQSIQVCVLVHPRLLDGFQLGSTDFTEHHLAEHYGFFHSGRWMRSQWHNTKDVTHLLQWNLEEVKNYANNKSLMLNNQFVLTPGVGGIMDVIQLLVGYASLRPVTFAMKLYQQDALDAFLRDHADEAWNIVMLDFFDLAPALVSFLISLNFRATMKVLTAVATTTEGGAGNTTAVDVTEMAQRLVCRQRVLYLTNIAKDLDLPFVEGTLTMAYQIGNDKQHHILMLEFNESTEVVISQYTQNVEGTLLHVDTETTGALYHGKIISQD